MKSDQLRKSFLKFFADRGHTVVSSSSLIPAEDPTLIFTNAGMNQFKGIFLGTEKRDYVRAASVQKCIRVSGKHNDLEEIGKSVRHHTFFEMLGNWSFGDYYKKEAVEFAWDYITGVLKLPEERLSATIYEDDNDAGDVWKKVAGLPESRILRFGKKDNFWEMGDTGPCGPCTEIHLDLGKEFSCGRANCGPNCPCGRFMELWNLVFIQYNRDGSGKLHELPAKHVDTGMGLERILAFLQGSRSNYDTDLFTPVITELERLSRKEYRGTPDPVPFRVIADHIRALSFAIADGATPSNEGRGYVVRRILRRAARYGRKLDLHEPFLYRLVSKVTDIMGAAYPELKEKANHVSLIIKGEEEGFYRTLDRGLELFDEVVTTLKKKGQNVIPGKDAFKLYDTYGFPLDLTELMAGETGMEVDRKGFEKSLQAQRSSSRVEKSKGKEYARLPVLNGGTEFTGYENHRLNTAISAIYKLPAGEGEGPAPAEIISEGDGAMLVLESTPFYAESGGQAGDKGVIRNAEGESQSEFIVENTEFSGKAIVHTGKVSRGKFHKGMPVLAEIDLERRLSIARNHTATHLLHNALREVLGSQVQQEGSLVDENHLRFDFNYFKQVEERQMELIEEKVYEKIMKNSNLRVDVLSISEAKKRGALAFFGEKYGEEVRMVSIGDFSKELCGGTHLSATGEIGFFKIISEGSVASGIRRIEAVTGRKARETVKETEAVLEKIAGVLKVPQARVAAQIESLASDVKRLQKELSKYREKSSASLVSEILSKSEDFRGSKLVFNILQDADANYLRLVADQLRVKLREDKKEAVVILGGLSEGKVFWVCAVTEGLVNKGLHAGKLIDEAARLTGGGGGGRPDLAQAGGKDPSMAKDALEKVSGLIKEKL